MGWIVVVALVLLVMIVIGMYNSLVRLRAACDSAWADIEPLPGRTAPVPAHGVEAGKAYAAHERGAVEAVIKAGAKAMSAQGPEAKGTAETQLTQSLKSLFALAEAYPQLRAVEAFNQLQGSLNQIEDAVQNARRYYNAVVRDYNAKTQEIPTNLIAGWFNFVGRQFFELTDTTQREPPQVQF